MYVCIMYNCLCLYIYIYIYIYIMFKIYRPMYVIYRYMYVCGYIIVLT